LGVLTVLKRRRKKKKKICEKGFGSSQRVAEKSFVLYTRHPSLSSKKIKKRTHVARMQQ
jgi:hypothetical protein